MSNKADQDFISTLPVVKNAGLLSIEPVHHGTINKTYQVHTQQGIWAARINQNTMPGINRSAEIDILKQIQHLNVAPAMVAYDSEQQYLITEWVSGNSWTPDDLANPELLRKLKAKLQPLHDIFYDNKATYLMARIMEYNLYFSGAADSLKQAINTSVKKLNKTGFWQKQNRLLHFDLHPGNIIGHDDPIIIDWEYAGSGHPMLEWLVIQHYAESDISAFIPKMYQTAEFEEAHELISLLMELWQS